MKRAFKYISRGQLLTQMIKLKIDKDLVTWTRSFLINRKVQLVINGYDNKKKIETGIFQGFLVSPILFFIYISGVFDKMLNTNPLVTSLLFINDLRFIVASSLLKEIARTLKKVT